MSSDHNWSNIAKGEPLQLRCGPATECWVVLGTALWSTAANTAPRLQNSTAWAGRGMQGEPSHAKFLPFLNASALPSLPLAPAWV